MNLGLGTVQFGLDYGITNASGKTPAVEVGAILAEAAASGVALLDTAALYGDAESVLGQQLRSFSAPNEFRIVSKTVHLAPHQPLPAALAAVRAGVHASLSKLGISKLYALLVHRSDDLLGPAGEALFAELLTLRESGLVEKIGVSVYAPDELAMLIGRFPIDVVQLPINVLDQRMLRTGMLAKLRERRIEIHARSAFLQGVLLLDSLGAANQSSAPRYPTALTPVLTAFQSRQRELDLSPLEATLGFLNSLDAIDVVVCGAARLSEWQAICRSFSTLPKLSPEVFADLAQDRLELIDPRRWAMLAA